MTNKTENNNPRSPDFVLLQELKGSVDFFLNYTNQDKTSPGYGLTVDSTKNPQIASIASSGFALSAWVIAAQRGFITRPIGGDEDSMAFCDMGPYEIEHSLFIVYLPLINKYHCQLRECA